MKQYLIDTNICVYYIKGLFNLHEKFAKIGADNLYISEITIAELKYGVENSIKKKDNRKTIERFISSIQIVPIIGSLDIYAREKAKLKKKGQLIDDFDLLIGSSAIANEMVLVTGNVKHFDRISGIKIENWVDKHFTD